MILLRQCAHKLFRKCYFPPAAMRRQLMQTSHFRFSRSKQRRFAPIAGGGFSTDELYADARETPAGTAAQDTAGHAQRLSAGPPDRIWSAPFVQFSAQPAAAFARGN